MTEPRSPEVIVALDFRSPRDALELTELLGASARFYKVGLELFSRTGPSIVRELKARGKRIFLDLKLFDIPNTVAGAVAAAAEEGVDLLTVHALGGGRMLAAAREAAGPELRLLAVTLLTSLDRDTVGELWGRKTVSMRDEVVRLARLAREHGVDGVVSSPLETRALRERLGPELVVVNPGIRMPGESRHDQTRVTTPVEAAEAGADYLVMGRSITRAEDPRTAMETVRSLLASGAPGEAG